MSTAARTAGETWLFTSEAVSEGYPGNLADRVSDEILGGALRRNQRARVALETRVTAGRCMAPLSLQRPRTPPTFAPPQHRAT